MASTRAPGSATRPSDLSLKSRRSTGRPARAIAASAALAAGVAGGVGLVGSSLAERARAATIFGSEPIAEGQAIALAQPLAGNRWNLIVLEQLQPAPACWRENADGSVLTYESEVAEGVCGRYLSSSAYSLRVNGNDLSSPWRLKVESENGQLQLLATNPQQTTPITVASGRVPSGAQLAALKMAPGWTFQRRTYGNESLRHLYVSHAEPLPVLIARARAGSALASLPAITPPPSVGRGPSPASAGSRPSSRLARLERLTRSRQDDTASRETPRLSGVIPLEVVPYGS